MLMRKYFPKLFAITAIIVLSLSSLLLVSTRVEAEQDNQQDQKITVHLFASKTCPHCKKEKEFLQSYMVSDQDLEVMVYEIAQKENVDLLRLVADKLDTQVAGVPFTVVGDQYFVGYLNDETDGKKIENLVSLAKANQAGDVVSQLIVDQNLKPKVETLYPQEDKVEVQSPAEIDQIDPANIKLPLFGEVNLQQYSLLGITFLIAFLDGFNPCAMWTLMFLITLLLGMKDRRRMWILGVAFILASGIVYFLFMSAWLNLFMFLGFITWIRIAIGLLALGTGGYYLWDFITNKSGECKVDAGGQKKKIFNKLTMIAKKPQLWLALVGIVSLAFAVNLVELVCSAGLPAIYTQFLTMGDLPAWQYYGYLSFYILIFMLDDIVVFAIAMITLRGVVINSKYARLSHLIGGLIMLLIGWAMLFKPELIMFG